MKKLVVTAFTVIATLSAYAQKKQTGHPDVDSLINNPDTVAVQHKLKALGNGTEKDMLTVLNYYFTNNSKKDSVLNLILQRYPKGEVAFNEAQHKMFAEDDAEKREKLFIKLKEQFPDRDLDQGYYVVSDAYARSKNLPKMQEYFDQIKDVSKKRIAIGYNAQRVYQYNPAAAEALLKPEIERLTNAGVPQGLGPMGRYYAFFNLYGEILSKQGKYQEALKYIQDAYNYFTPKSDLLTSDYGLVTYKNGLYKEALPALEKLIDEAKANAEIKSAFIESYEKVNPGKKASDYRASVNMALKAKIEAAVAKRLINEPSPNFEVQDIHGKKVSLADFRGKTIMLDFWATWCGPCKASFPSMQRVVNNYKKDPNVKFLFIHTLERAPNPLTDAKQYLSDNHYSFDLYMDQINPKTKKNDAVAAFGPKGIPAKFVIDGKGNICFKVVGFSGGEDETVMEISDMIEMAKKAS